MDWRPVPGFEAYEVSDGGDVRSLSSRWGERPTPRRVRTFKWRGYVYAGLRRDNRQEKLRVHRLVLEAFVGPCPEGMEACHNNGVRDDNRLENLRWDTRAANAADTSAHGRKSAGERHGCAKLRLDQVRAIRAESGTAKYLAERYGVSTTSIYDIRNGKCWKDAPLP